MTTDKNRLRTSMLFKELVDLELELSFVDIPLLTREQTCDVMSDINKFCAWTLFGHRNPDDIILGLADRTRERRDD